MRKILFLAAVFLTELSFAQAPELVIPKGHTGDISVMAISLDNKLLASGGRDQTVILWDYASGKELKTFDGYPNWIGCIAISPDNKKLVTGSSDELRVNDLSQSGKEIFKQKVHQSSIAAIAFNTDGTLLATSSYLKEADATGKNVELIIWNIDGMVKVKRILFKGETASEMRFQNNNQLLFVGQKQIYSINIATASVTKTHEINNDYRSYSLSPDGKWVAVNDYDNTEVNDAFGFSAKVGDHS